MAGRQQRGHGHRRPGRHGRCSGQAENPAPGAHRTAAAHDLLDRSVHVHSGEGLPHRCHQGVVVHDRVSCWSGGCEVIAQRGDGPGQMGGHRAWRDAEHLRGAGGIQIEEQPQGDDLPLPAGKSQQRRHDLRIDGTVGGLAGGRQVRDRAGICQRHLPAAAAPPGDVRVQRGADHPRRRHRMPAHRAPGRPRSSEGLGNKLLRRVSVTDTHQDAAEAVILSRAVELRELHPFGSHARSTHNQRTPLTWPITKTGDGWRAGQRCPPPTRYRVRQHRSSGSDMPVLPSSSQVEQVRRHSGIVGDPLRPMRPVGGRPGVYPADHDRAETADVHGPVHLARRLVTRLPPTPSTPRSPS